MIVEGLVRINHVSGAVFSDPSPPVIEGETTAVGQNSVAFTARASANSANKDKRSEGVMIVASADFSRRTWLRGALAAVLAPRMTCRAIADQAVLERRQPVGLKISCSSLAFTDLPWDKALEEIKALGFRYADLAMFENWAHVNPSGLEDPEVHAKKISSACARLEIEPIAIHASLVIGDPKQFPGLTIPDPAARKTMLAHFERIVTCARAADIPLINVMPGRFIDGVARDTCLKNAVDVLTQMHALAARRGLMLSFENHTDTIAQHPDDCLALLERVPGLRLDYDLSHVVCNEYSLEQTLPLFKYVSHVGIRNARPGDYNLPLDDGRLSYPIAPMLDALRRERVNAYVSVEYFRPAERASIAGLKAILEKQGLH